MKLGKQNL